jgi:hypothetical protein
MEMRLETAGNILINSPTTICHFQQGLKWEKRGAGMEIKDILYIPSSSIKNFLGDTMVAPRHYHDARYRDEPINPL